jgi:hypothetical protein
MHRVSRPYGSLLFNDAYLPKRSGDLEGTRAIYRRINHPPRSSAVCQRRLVRLKTRYDKLPGRRGGWRYSES